MRHIETISCGGGPILLLLGHRSALVLYGPCTSPCVPTPDASSTCPRASALTPGPCYTSTVLRILVAALLLILVGQTTGALSFLTPCDEQCSAEQGGAASCLPGCPECACCGMARVLLR